MPTIQFIEVNPSDIIAETIAKYESIAGYTLNPADVERIMIDVIAYREQSILAKMETAMHQNFVQLANGTSLDYLGELFGVLRVKNEEDDDYRIRILAQNRFQPIGTRAFYISKIKTLDFVSDVILISKQDNNTLPPGVIMICAIEKVLVTQPNVYSGNSLTDSAQEQMILDVLNDYKVNLIGDMFHFTNAVPIFVDGTIVVKKKIGVNPGTLLTEIEDIVSAYFWGLSLGFNNDFANNDLMREILKNDNVLSIVSNSFPNLPIKQRGEFWKRGNIQITII